MTTLQCKVFGYTVCRMDMEAVEYKSFKFEDRFLPVEKCTQGIDIQKHKKKRPVCKDVTKQNCVTKWEINANGQKVS